MHFLEIGADLLLSSVENLLQEMHQIFEEFCTWVCEGLCGRTFFKVGWASVEHWGVAAKVTATKGTRYSENLAGFPAST